MLTCWWLGDDCVAAQKTIYVLPKADEILWIYYKIMIQSQGKLNNTFDRKAMSHHIVKMHDANKYSIIDSNKNIVLNNLFQYKHCSQ